MTTRLQALLLLLPLAACAAPRAPEPLDTTPAQSPGPATDSIVLERTLCYGLCPAYRLRLAGTGQVLFESRNPQDSGRTAADTVPPATILTLLREAESLGFFELPDVIADDRQLCPDRATDHHTATVTIYRAAGLKRVEDYRGCYARRDHSVVPVIGRLRAFETAIDSAANSGRWVRPASRR